MGGRKNTVEKRGKKVFYTFDTFRLYEKSNESGGVLSAKESLNCDCGLGKITGGIGLKPSYNEGKAQRSISPSLALIQFVYARAKGADKESVRDFLGAATETGVGMVGFYNESTALFSDWVSCGNSPRMAAVLTENGETVTLVGGTSGVYALQPAGGALAIYLHDLAGGTCVCKNRVFHLQKRNMLVYSDPTSYERFASSIDDGGCLDLPMDKGEGVALETLNGDLFVFMEYGVICVEVAGSARDFKIREIPYTGGKIFGDTVRAFGENILFLAKDGTYAMNGKGTRRICEHAKLLPQEGLRNCGSAIVEDTFGVWFTDCEGQKRLFFINSDCQSGYFATAYEGLGGGGNRAFCRVGAYVYEASKEGVLPANEKRIFTSDKLFFGSQKRKTVKTIRFEGKGVIICRLRRDDGFALQETLLFSDGQAEFSPCLRGEHFALEFELQDGAELWEMKVEVAYGR